MTIEERYQELCRTPSDINEHLKTLREYADKCSHVTEFGVRGCVSLHAFLVSKAKKVVAYDIANVNVPKCDKLTFICADVLKVDIEPTDLLFIDSFHTESQLRTELDRHSGNVRHYIAMHDTTTFGEVGEDGGRGLMFALRQFLRVTLDWNICYETSANNGLVIISRVPDAIASNASEA